MKTKHLIALFGLSACFACSSLTNSAINKTCITPPESNLPSASKDNGNNQAPKSGADNGNDITKLKITFDLNGGTYGEGQETYVIDNVMPTTYFAYLTKQAPGLDDIIYPNHIFKGYSLAEDDPTLIPNNYVVKESITVYAQYIIDPAMACTVKWLDKDGSTILSAEEYAVGDTPSFKGELPVYEGYVFDHWNPTPSPITEEKAGQTIDYQAVYVPCDRYHTVTLDYNDGSPNINYQYVVDGKYASDPNITYLGHNLIKWIYLEGGATFTFNTPITQDISIQAVWEIDTCNIDYIANGGVITSEIDSVTYGSTIATAPTLAGREGYDKSLVTWYTTPDFKDNTQFIFGTTLVNGDLTLYAKWPSLNQVTVTFNGNGGTWDSDATKGITIDYGTTVYPPTNPIKADNTFVGWYSLATGGVEVDFSQAIKENIEVFAHWQITTNYTITFDSDGGSAVAAITVAKGTSISEPTDDPSKTGYTFTKWTVDGTDVSFPYTVNADKTFKAVYTANQYSVQFNPNGGKWSDETSTAKDVQGNYQTLPTIENPTNGTMVFVGWKRASDNKIGILPIDVTAQGQTYSEIYTAQWERGGDVYHTVTFNSQGGSAVVEQHVIEGQTAIKPTDPTKEGYNFQYWYSTNEDVEFNFTTAINADIVLNAKWQDKTYIVNWYDEDGVTPLDSQEYDKNANLVLPDADITPNKFDTVNRYRFSKWAPNASTSIKVNKDMSFYAVYNVDNDIEFMFNGGTYTIDGLSTINEVYSYGDLISYSFDQTYPTGVTLKVDGTEVSSGYDYNPSSGKINIYTINESIRNATCITLEVE